MTKDQPAYKEELFGPVFSLMSFKDDKEGIDMANDNMYGLSGSVFSKNLERA